MRECMYLQFGPAIITPAPSFPSAANQRPRNEHCSSTMEEKTFSWLHISDQHIGMPGSSHLWPQVREAFFEDLKNFIDRGIRIDLVIFSGDLVQQGTAGEFKGALKELKNLFEKLAEYGIRPAFFIVPGNHDLVRIDEASGVPFVITEAGKGNDLYKKSLLKKSANSDQISAAFKNYTKFINGLRQEGIELIGDTSGVFSGDASGKLEVRGLKVGIVGLNTAWSHLCGGDYKGKVEVFPEQFSALVGNSPGSWTASNNINILVTHHPVSWFSPNSRASFNSEIFIPKYFDLHLCGHMHEIEAVAADFGNGSIKRQIQGASLFGMERDKVGCIQRHHGYVYGKISATTKTLTLWPRLIERNKNTGWKISIDTERLTDDGDSVVFPIEIRYDEEEKKK